MQNREFGGRDKFALSGTYTRIDDASGKRVQLSASKDIVSPVQLAARRGYDIAQIHEAWTETQGYPKTDLYGPQFTSLANGVDQVGMKFIPYIGFQIGDNSSEYQDYKDEIVVEPWADGHGWHRDNPPHVGYDCNYAGQWQNFMIYYIEKLIREKGIGGLYLDGTSIPLGDKNLHNGTGYYDRNGILRPSYPIFERREYFKRIRTIAQQYDPSFWMDIHTTVGIWTPVASFADSYWCGEQFEMMMVDTGKSLRQMLTDEAPLDAYRAWFGSQFGLYGYFLNYNSPTDAESLSLLHDTPLRNVNDPCLERTKDKFGTENATWYGYYANSSYVSSSDSNVKISFYQKANGDILFVLANLGTTASTPTVTLLSPLGNLQGAEVRDAVSREILTHTNTTISVPLEPWRARLVVVEKNAWPDVTAAYWKFDSSGALCDDSSGNGYNLTNSGVAWSSDKAITALGTGSAYFNGSQATFSTSSNLNLSGINKMEVSWWAKHSMANNSVGMLFEQTANFSQYAGAICCDWEGPGRMNFNVCKGPGLSWWTSSISGGNDGQWHFYRAVLDRSATTATDFIKFYRDGQLLGQLVQNPGTGWEQPFYNSGRMYVGSRADSQYKYAGYQDELKIVSLSE